MAAYPPGPTRMVDLPAYGANSAPTDRFWIASAAVGFALGAAADRYITPNEFLAEITRNITDISVQFGNGDGVSTVSAASKGKVRYNATTQTFQVSKNAAAYVNLLTGSGTATRVAFWSAADQLSSDAAFYWQNTDKRLGIGVGTTPDAPLDILADGTALAQQWRQNAGALRVQMILDNVPEGSLGTSTNHTFHLLSNNLQRLTVENDGLIGINKAAAIQAQLQVVSQDATTEALILNSAATPLVNLAEFYNDSSIRFAFSPAANLGIGLSGAGGATGSITLNGVTSGAVTVNVAAAAGTWTLTLPTTDGNANQFLQTDGNGITTWATAITGAAPPAASVQFNDGSNGFDGDPDFLWDTASGTLQLGVALSRTGKLQLRSIVSGSVTHTVGTPSAAHVLAWPDALPTALQVLTAGAVVGNDVTLSWTTPSAGATINPTDTVIPFRFNSTTFNDSPLSVASSAVTMTRSAIGVTSADGIILLNATAAAAGAQQFSPRLRLTGQGWKTNATAGSQTVDWILENQPVQGAANPTSNVVLSAQVNAGGYTQRFSVSSNGLATITPTTTAIRAAISMPGFLASQIYVGNYASILFVAPNEDGTGIGARLGPIDISLPSTATMGFASSTTTAITGGSDIALARSAAAVFRVSDASTGSGAVLIAPSTATVTGNFTVLPNNAATATIVTVARLGVNSTGTAADGFGAALSWSAETSTTNDTETGRINVFWTTATHASRTSAISFSLTNNATLAEVARIGTPSNNVGSPFVLTVHDGTNPNVWTAGSFAAKLYLISPTLPAVGVAAHFSATALDAPVWQMLRGRGTNASPTAAQNADNLGEIEWAGQTSTSTNNFAVGARIRVSATENYSAGNNGCDMEFFTSPNAGTITSRMFLTRTGTLRVGASSGTFNTTTLVQVGNYASWNTDVVSAVYTGANGTKGFEIVGTSGQTANLFRVFLDAGADLFNVLASGAFSSRALTVATLPSAATAGAGARSFVTDALTPVFGSAVAGGGAVNVPVYSDGANWIVG